MKLSPTQQTVVDHMTAGDGYIARYPGGFWARRGIVVPHWGIGGEWWATVQTVRALERLGVLERAHEFPEEWRDTRRLVTEAK